MSRTVESLVGLVSAGLLGEHGSIRADAVLTVLNHSSVFVGAQQKLALSVVNDWQQVWFLIDWGTQRSDEASQAHWHVRRAPRGKNRAGNQPGLKVATIDAR